MDMDSFIFHVKLEDLYENLVVNIEPIFNTSNYEVERPLLKRKNKLVIGLVKDELGRKIMKELVALRPNMYSYLMHDVHVDKRSKCTKKCAIKQEIKFED